ncbi:MAG: sulfotransferase [Flavobacteriaceae bacterium]|nr:sulfotransferase [Flavobacteriaceae bacterium]
MAFRSIQKQIERQYFNWKIQLQPEKNILFFGDPRGGTTWMGETLSSLFELPILWEPMLPRKDSRFTKYQFASRQFLPEDLQDVEIRSSFQDLLKGKDIDHWEIQHTSASELAKVKAAIIKFTRGNMLLPYITHHFTFEKQPIYMLRNPFAVVASQLKHAGWKEAKSYFEIPNAPFNEVYTKHEKFLNTLATKEEVLMAKWALTNKVVLDHPRHNKDWIFITYEETLVNPKITLTKILDRWGCKDKSFGHIDFAKKSRTSANAVIKTKEEQLNQWRNSFSNQQISAMRSVLNYFKIYYE